MLLSILIPTIYERAAQFDALKQFLQNQIDLHALNEQVEILWAVDAKEMSIGEKRDWLYTAARGEYSWMLDDDDGAHPQAIPMVVAALHSHPDCIGFRELCTINGTEYRSNISRVYSGWEGDGTKILEDGFHYHRTNFFKTPIRTNLCRQVGVKPLRWGEDVDFADRIAPLLQTEVYIDQWIYHYNHVSTNHNERYGITE
jgi:hypothetical protein